MTIDAQQEVRKAENLKALGHPTLVAILEILRRGEACVCRIYPELDSTQPNTSKHLAVLKKAGMLDSRREGTMTFYWVVDTRVYEIMELADAPTLVFATDTEACDCVADLCVASEQKVLNFLAANAWGFRRQTVDLG